MATGSAPEGRTEPATPAETSTALHLQMRRTRHGPRSTPPTKHAAASRRPSDRPNRHGSSTRLASTSGSPAPPTVSSGEGRRRGRRPGPSAPGGGRRCRGGSARRSPRSSARDVAPAWWDRDAAMSLPTISRGRDLICSARRPAAVHLVDGRPPPPGPHRGAPHPRRRWMDRPDPDRTRQWMLAVDGRRPDLLRARPLADHATATPTATPPRSDASRPATCTEDSPGSRTSPTDGHRPRRPA